MFDPFTLNQMLQDFGRDITLRKLSASAYDPILGTVARSPTDYTVRAYFYNDVPQMVEFTNVAFGSKRVALSAKLTNGSPTPTPEIHDQILYSGDTTSVTKVSPISSNNNVMCFILHTDE
jgi:hypothetical protein